MVYLFHAEDTPSDGGLRGLLVAPALYFAVSSQLRTLVHKLRDTLTLGRSRRVAFLILLKLVPKFGAGVAPKCSEFCADDIGPLVSAWTGFSLLVPVHCCSFVLPSLPIGLGGVNGLVRS